MKNLRTSQSDPELFDTLRKTSKKIFNHFLAFKFKFKCYWWSKKSSINSSRIDRKSKLCRLEVTSVLLIRYNKERIWVGLLDVVKDGSFHDPHSGSISLMLENTCRNWNFVLRIFHLWSSLISTDKNLMLYAINYAMMRKEKCFFQESIIFRNSRFRISNWSKGPYYIKSDANYFDNCTLLNNKI